MNDTIEASPSLSLDSFRQLMVAIRSNAGEAWNLIEGANQAGASDLARTLALLDVQPAQPGSQSTTKLELLHSSVLSLIQASQKVAELLGVESEGR